MPAVDYVLTVRQVGFTAAHLLPKTLARDAKFNWAGS